MIKECYETSTANCMTWSTLISSVQYYFNIIIVNLIKNSSSLLDKKNIVLSYFLLGLFPFVLELSPFGLPTSTKIKLAVHQNSDRFTF